MKQETPRTPHIPLRSPDLSRPLAHYTCRRGKNGPFVSRGRPSLLFDGDWAAKKKFVPTVIVNTPVFDKFMVRVKNGKVVSVQQKGKFLKKSENGFPSLKTLGLTDQPDGVYSV
jgi:hypothetical protein